MGKSGSTGRQIRIAVDAMGGDYAPRDIVRGAVQAASDFGVEIILVGPKAQIEGELKGTDLINIPIRLVEASEVIKDGEDPIMAALRKTDSSVAVATKLVKEGEADAVVSAGATGATAVCAMRYLGTVPGIERPMAGGAFLRLAPDTIVLDLGANVGCRPNHLVGFAAAGSIYAKIFHGIDNPTIGILNVGAEKGKGNEVVKEAYSLLTNSGLNFIGNVEGMDIPKGKANVIVCDGFIGNILLKFCEGLSEAVCHWLNQELRDRLSPDGLKNIVSELHQLISSSMERGGLLWGIDGVVGIAHGSSQAQQIIGTIQCAKEAIESGFVDQLRAELERVQAGMLIENK
jgi:glycerol-3-phosphate acyltransferase PlsX